MTTLRALLTRTLLTFAVATSAVGCDVETTEPEILHSAKLETIDAWTDGSLTYRIVELDGERRVVGEGEQDGLRLVVVGLADGDPVAAAVRDDGGLRRLDVEELLAGNAAVPMEAAADAVSETVLDLVLRDAPTFRFGLTSTPKTQEMPPLWTCLKCAWDSITIPDLISINCEICLGG